jgi:hypothetical protein
MKTIAIEQVKKGDFVRRKADSKTTYIMDGYCRFNKAYQLTDFNDMSKCLYIKKGKMVFIDFDF